MNDKNFDSCPVCHGLAVKFLFSINTGPAEFHLIQCPVCGLIRTFPLPSDETLRIHDIHSYYGGRGNKFNPLVQKVRNRITRTRARYCLSLIPDSIRIPKILDVGCAEGRLLKSFLMYGCQCWGIEHPSYPYRRFLDSDRITYLQGDLLDIDLPEEAFDIIVLWHVLEHMDDPNVIMRRLCRLLAPQGVIIAAVPNYASIEARCFRQFWFHLDIPWHKYHFSEGSLRYLTMKTQLRIIQTNSLCLEQGPYGLFQSILNAMGWPHNEFYEALKGNLTYGRSIYLTFQFYLGIALLLPVLFGFFITSFKGSGSILKLILKKKMSLS